MKSVIVHEQRVCRICFSSALDSFFSMGMMPKPNAYLLKSELQKPEARFPLVVAFCSNCSLMQLKHVVNPTEMFSHYHYIPSTSSTMRDHFGEMAASIAKRHDLAGRLVVDIGSNDGTLLQYFKNLGAEVLGIDPASNLAAVADGKSIHTRCDYFSSAIAKSIVEQIGHARLVTATNVLAHVDDVHDFCSGAKILLDDEGVLVFEVPYVVSLLSNNQFDTIYHEHLSYFSMTSLLHLFSLHDLQVIDVESTPVHGGSIQLVVEKGRKGSSHCEKVNAYLDREQMMGLKKSKPYVQFAQRAIAVKERLREVIEEIKEGGENIVGYGASAKGNMLLNYCEIDSRHVEYIVDSIPSKQGKYTPGTHIPIYSEERFDRAVAQYALLLAWNYEEEILKKRADFRFQGGRFIKFVPDVQIL